MWLSTGVTSPRSSSDSPRPLSRPTISTFVPLLIMNAPAIGISNSGDLSSLLCHFCPNRLCSAAVQITGIQERLKNRSRSGRVLPTRPSLFFYNKSCTCYVFCRLKAFCEPLARLSSKLVMSFLAFLSVRQKEKWFPSPGSEAKRIAQMAVWPRD